MFVVLQYVEPVFIYTNSNINGFIHYIFVSLWNLPLKVLTNKAEGFFSLFRGVKQTFVLLMQRDFLSKL